MAGYYSCSKNYSMSKRAEYAYSCGERPISKWTKKEVLEMVADEYSYWDDFELIENFVKKPHLKKLKKNILNIQDGIILANFTTLLNFTS